MLPERAKMLATFVCLAMTALTVADPASTANLEVTHWWTSGREAVAVKNFAEKFDALGDDGVITGRGSIAGPIIVSVFLAAIQWSDAAQSWMAGRRTGARRLDDGFDRTCRKAALG